MQHAAEQLSEEALWQGMNITPTVDADSQAWQAQLEGCVRQLAAGLQLHDRPTVPLTLMTQSSHGHTTMMAHCGPLSTVRSETA